jgi:hypothetical protein
VALRAFVGDANRLRRLVARGQLSDARIIERRMARLEERHRPMHRFFTATNCAKAAWNGYACDRPAPVAGKCTPATRSFNGLN